MSKSRFGSTDWARTEARDTDPSPHSDGSLNGGGCERAWVTVGCDKRRQTPHIGKRQIWATGYASPSPGPSANRT